WVFALMSSGAFSAAALAADPLPASGNTSCRACHTEVIWTQPSLATRPATSMPAHEAWPHQGPAMILLDMLKGREDGEDFFGPVPFNHAGHAGMTGNCTICHHYTPAGQPHPECRS